jgi:hypothetical protein
MSARHSASRTPPIASPAAAPARAQPAAVAQRARRQGRRRAGAAAGRRGSTEVNESLAVEAREERGVAAELERLRARARGRAPVGVEPRRLQDGDPVQRDRRGVEHGHGREPRVRGREGERERRGAALEDKHLRGERLGEGARAFQVALLPCRARGGGEGAGAGGGGIGRRRGADRRRRWRRRRSRGGGC